MNLQNGVPQSWVLLTGEAPDAGAVDVRRRIRRGESSLKLQGLLGSRQGVGRRNEMAGTQRKLGADRNGKW